MDRLYILKNTITRRKSMIVPQTYSIPKEIIEWVKLQSAKEQRPASNYVTKVLREKMNRTKK